jgi:hypothetical protein
MLTNRSIKELNDTMEIILETTKYLTLVTFLVSSCCCCQVEKDYYYKVDNVIRFLTQWSTNQTNFIERAERLFTALHEQDYIKKFDLHLTKL